MPRSRADRRRHPVTGCRPHSLLGHWAVEPVRFRQMYGVAVKADLSALAAARAESRGGDDGDGDDDLYELLPGGVARFCLSGPLVKYPTSFDCMFGCSSTVYARRAVRAAAADPNVRGLLLEIDSPGGCVAGTPDLAGEVAAFRAAKPVVAACSDLCCSGAYWVASQADRVFCNVNAGVGNIGCYSVLEDTTGLQDQVGIKLRLVTTGPYKGLGADGRVTDALVEDVQREVDAIHALFVAAVAAGRGMDPAAAAALADGRAYIGRQAVDAGLADGIATAEQAAQYLNDYLSAPAGAAH